MKNKNWLWMLALLLSIVSVSAATSNVFFTAQRFNDTQRVFTFQISIYNSTNHYNYSVTSNATSVLQSTNSTTNSSFVPVIYADFNNSIFANNNFDIGANCLSTCEMYVDITYANGSTMRTETETLSGAGGRNFVNNVSQNVPVNNIVVYARAAVAGTQNICVSNCEIFIQQPGYINVTLEQGNYTVYVNDSSYAQTATNFSFSTAYDQKTLTLYSENSVSIFVYDEQTGALINGTNLTIQMDSNLYSVTQYTTNGTKFVDVLYPTDYSVKISGGSYGLRSYILTIVDNQTTNLYAYLTTNSQNTTLIISGETTTNLLEGAIASMARLINTNWTTVESRTSDIAGSVSFNYGQYVRYRFTVSKAGYQDKVFYLDPVTESSYNVILNRETSDVDDQDLAGIGVVTAPSIFYNNVANNFSFTITSPTNILDSYNVTLTYPGGSNSSAGTNPQGQTILFGFNITNANAFDTVDLFYSYTSNNGSQKNFSYSYSIQNATSTLGTFIKNKTTDYGLGVFERVLIATMIALVLAGLLYVYIGSAGAILGLLMVYGYLSYLNFIPFWAMLIVGLAGFVSLMRDNR